MSREEEVSTFAFSVMNQVNTGPVLAKTDHGHVNPFNNSYLRCGSVTQRFTTTDGLMCVSFMRSDKVSMVIRFKRYDHLSKKNTCVFERRFKNGSGVDLQNRELIDTLSVELNRLVTETRENLTAPERGVVSFKFASPGVLHSDGCTYSANQIIWARSPRVVIVSDNGEVSNVSYRTGPRESAWFCLSCGVYCAGSNFTNMPIVFNGDDRWAIVTGANNTRRLQGDQFHAGKKIQLTTTDREVLLHAVKDTV